MSACSCPAMRRTKSLLTPSQGASPGRRARISSRIASRASTSWPGWPAQAGMTGVRRAAQSFHLQTNRLDHLAVALIVGADAGGEVGLAGGEGIAGAGGRELGDQ